MDPAALAMVVMVTVTVTVTVTVRVAKMHHHCRVTHLWGLRVRGEQRECKSLGWQGSR